MWNGIQKTIALIGIGLIVLTCLFPPVWRDGECGRVFAYVFIGRYLALQAANELRTDIAWVELLFQLAAIGMGTVALILDTGRENHIAQSITRWVVVCTLVFIQFIGFYSYCANPETILIELSWWVAFGCNIPIVVLLALIIGSSVEAIGMESQTLVPIGRLVSWLETVKRKFDFRKLSIPVRLVLLLSGWFLLGVAFWRTQCAEDLNGALITATQAQDVKGVTALLRRGANPNAIQFHEEIRDGLIGTCTFVYKTTPLDIAADEGNQPLVKLLLEHGAKSNVKLDSSR